MKHKNTILFSSLLILSFVVFFGPKIIKSDEKSPSKLMAEFMSTERYINADELAEKLVNKDPSILLIDLRSKAEFDKYHIPSAINIPFETLLNEENESIINQDRVSLIFYSNDHLLADQAWFLTNSNGYKNLIVLKEGLNGFYETILNPVIPSEGMPQEDFERYTFRKAAGIFFGVPYDATPAKIEIKEAVVKSAPTTTVTPVKKVKVEVEEGGC
ncbi:MAG: rhodanese-like domain-containing protein [Flavobacteriaceae bacterium]|nr:rhodanese-like domain-containing protein [Flavobacteriaceae bacterium]